MRLAKTFARDNGMLKDRASFDKREILEMIKILSHDIRSPLVTIAAGLKLLKKGAYGPIDKGVTEEVETLYEIVTKTAGNMEDFMERASSLDGDLSSPHEPLDINEDIIAPVLDEVQKELKNKKIIFENGISAKGFYITVGNRFLLKAVVRNLLVNALKYGGNGCEISLDIEEHGSLYKLSIFNSGSPVPLEKRKLLFTKFCRINKRDSGGSEGMGLGLFLVKEIIERLGGRIRYEAVEDGSNFIFTLPKYIRQATSSSFLLDENHYNDRLFAIHPLSQNLSC